jgi:AcrR family transcriptional regulator
MPKVTQEHLDARRRQIVNAAMRCFARKGFQRTTMQDIFREAELSPGAVYSYFDGKDEIVRAIVVDLMRILGEIAAVLSEPLPDGRLRRPGEALAKLIADYRDIKLGTFDDLARIFPHLIGELLRDPELKAAVQAGLERVRAGYEQLARAAQERGELDPAVDPVHIGRPLIALVQGLLIQYAVYDGQVDVDAYARTAVAMIDGQSPEESGS